MKIYPPSVESSRSSHATERRTSMVGEKIGLIAGWGRFPILVAESLRRRGCRVFCLGIRGHADGSLAQICHDYRSVGLAKMGRHLRYFRQNGVEQATMAGKIHKVLLFQKHFVWNHIPDLQCVRTFLPHFLTGTADRQDDTLLSAAVAGYQRGGVTITPATDLVPELLVNYGQLSGPRLSRQQRLDVEFAWKLAKQMGKLDVGQTVAVKGQAVLAVEAVEGTDQCIRRAGMLCPSGGFTVVKVSKPCQDMRFDVPAIGVGTLQTLAEAGGSLLAIEADKTIVIDQKQVASFARRNGLTVVAAHDGKIAEDLLEAA